MTKDFARRSASPKKKTRRRSRPATPGPQRVLFHGPSFSSGAIVGALVVLIAAYAPEFLDSRTGPDAKHPAASDSAGRTVTFEFDKLLRDAEVTPDLDAYPVPDPAEEAERSYTLQAASFRTEARAEQLRAALTLENLPVRVAFVGGWYRVIVGPFDRKVDADRAMTRLRQRQLAAAWVNNHN